MKLIPASDEATRDPELRGNPLAVYRYLLDELEKRQLDIHDWIEVKRLVVCIETGVGKTAVADALDTLIRRGYVEMDTSIPLAPGQARRYRLNFRRHEPLDSEHPQHPAA